MFRSLWFRLTGTVVLVVVVTMIIALVASLVIMQREFVNFVNSAVDTLQREPVEITVPEVQVDPDVRVLPDFGATPELPGDEPGRRSSDETLRWNFPGPVPDELEQRLNELADRQGFPSVNVQVPQTVQDDAGLFLETMTNTLMGAICISSVLALLASTWLFWGITRPLSRLRQATEAVAAGDLGARAPVKRRDEVGRTAEAFNTMADELERQEGLRKQMVADVAHELRTPLSVMRGNIEAMIDELIPTSEEELDAVHGEVMRLSRLVEDLRLLSLADAGELQLDISDVDVASLVETAVRRLTPAAEAKNIILSGDIGRYTGAIMGDEGKLQQVLANLITNALRYTPAGKTVTVSARAVGQDVWLAVTDQGPGIDPADLPNFFERFWKGDRSRSRSASASGSGLGLSIVRQIVELHGGRVEAALPQEGGL
ncbi:MAG TPA: ATP-binding protein, partial [Anaerolineae bacterium]|nr:ATP-binding protein [Anaerolineae bacterium]